MYQCLRSRMRERFPDCMNLAKLVEQSPTHSVHMVLRVLSIKTPRSLTFDWTSTVPAPRFTDWMSTFPRLKELPSQMNCVLSAFNLSRFDDIQLSISPMQYDTASTRDATEFGFIDLQHLPNAWNHSIINPKFKKGQTSNPANYCPIALTCTCYKILESIISSAFTEFLLIHIYTVHWNLIITLILGVHSRISVITEWC